LNIALASSPTAVDRSPVASAALPMAVALVIVASAL
jgi:hypothetical protein